MPDAYVADDTGALKRGQGLWVADAAGALKPATNAWVADANGALKRFWPPTPPATNLVYTAGSPAWLQNVISWGAVPGATSYELLANGASLANSAALTYNHAVEPLSQTDYVVRSHNQSGYNTSTTLTVTTPGMPAPASLRSTAVAYNSITMAWNGVSGADSYELVHSSNNSRIYLGASTSTSFAASASTGYSFKVRAWRGSIAGGWSSAVGVNTPAVPGPAHGVYEYAPVAFSTWQNGTPGGSTFDDPKWRPQSDGMWVNNGSNYGSTRGTQTCFYFYDWSGIQNQLRNGRVTRLQILMYRVTGTGVYSPQPCRWWMHKYAGATGGTPGWGGDVQGGDWYDTLDDEEYKWIDLPAGWGQQFVDTWWKGIAIGNDEDRNRHMKLVRDGGHATGNIKFTIG